VISKRGGSGAVVKGRNPSHALLDHHSRRRAHHDGQHSRAEALFYYFRLEDQVPEAHLLRLIGKHISFEFLRERLKESYSETGRNHRLTPNSCCAFC
jgi:hypothetical protein